jgi:hypothetical protein
MNLLNLFLRLGMRNYLYNLRDRLFFQWPKVLISIEQHTRWCG